MTLGVPRPQKEISSARFKTARKLSRAQRSQLHLSRIQPTECASICFATPGVSRYVEEVDHGGSLLLAKTKLLFLAVLMTATLLVSTPTVAPASEARDDQITRLYLSVLGRNPDAGGHAYWSERLASGESLLQLVRVMLNTPEVEERSSGDLIVDIYRNALGREPDAGGYDFWSAQDPWVAVVGISESPEHQQRTGTLPPPAVPAPSAASTPATSHVQALSNPSDRADVAEGWVDAGHGVFLPPVLVAIRWCESSDNYAAANRRSSARGAYQFLTGSWDWYGHADRYGVPQAHLATPAQQDEAALITWQADGTRPWNASRHCWG